MFSFPIITADKVQIALMLPTSGVWCQSEHSDAINDYELSYNSASALQYMIIN